MSTKKKKVKVKSKAKKINIAEPYTLYAGLPPSQLAGYKIVGIDPAKCNPGINVEIRNGETTQTLLLECKDLTDPSLLPPTLGGGREGEGTPTLGGGREGEGTPPCVPTQGGKYHNPTYQILDRYLFSIYPLIRDANMLVTEKQPRKVGRVTISEDAMRVGQHIISWFLHYVPNITIIEVDSRLRREMLSISLPKGHKQSELKDLMIIEAFRLAFVRGDRIGMKLFGEYLKNLDDQKAAGKKVRRKFRCHDMADSKIIVELGLQCLGLTQNYQNYYQPQSPPTHHHVTPVYQIELSSL